MCGPGSACPSRTIARPSSAPCALYVCEFAGLHLLLHPGMVCHGRRCRYQYTFTEAPIMAVCAQLVAKTVCSPPTTKSTHECTIDTEHKALMPCVIMHGDNLSLSKQRAGTGPRRMVPERRIILRRSPLRAAGDRCGHRPRVHVNQRIRTGRSQRHILARRLGVLLCHDLPTNMDSASWSIGCWLCLRPRSSAQRRKELTRCSRPRRGLRL
eukprot:SAG31_NODE_38_length_31498_cov_41.930539_9_plen_211_part_00